MNQSTLLKQIISAAETQNSVLFVFDIDSTLYNVSPRNVEIIKDFAQKKSNLDTSLQSLLLQVEASPKDWGIKPPLLRLNVPHPDQKLFIEIKQHWNQFFFSGDFLHHDIEYPGAVQFVNTLSERAPTFYLTGRDVERMGTETLTQLQQSQFPVDPEHNRLILKPNKEMLDHEYKLNELIKLSKEFKTIYFFENEPIILNEVINHFTENNVIPICVDSTHSGRAEIDPRITVITPDYTLEELP